MNEASPDCHLADAATAQGDCRGTGGMQEPAFCHPLRWRRKLDWPQITEVHMKGMNSVSPESRIFAYRECSIFDVQTACSFCCVLVHSWLPPSILGAVSQSWLVRSSWAAVLILPQIKLNWHLSSCACFLVDTEKALTGSLLSRRSTLSSVPNAHRRRWQDSSTLCL